VLTQGSHTFRPSLLPRLLGSGANSRFTLAIGLPQLIHSCRFCGEAKQGWCQAIETAEFSFGGDTSLSSGAA
jgi:hypothetical protein